MKQVLFTILLSIILSLVILHPIFGQIVTNIVNQNTIGGNDNDYPLGICKVDNAYMITGSSNSGISGDKTDASNGYSDTWMVKVDEDLSILWQKSFGGNMVEKGMNVICTGAGNCIVSGTTSSSMNGDVDSLGFGDDDFWIFKMDSSGNIIWQNVLGGSGIEAGGLMVQLPDGNIIVAGGSTSDSSGYKTEPSRGSFDYWIVCIDSTGIVLWDKTYGGDQPDNLTDVMLLNDDQLLLAGNSASSISGEKSEACFGMSDVWLININTSNGDIIWDKTIGGSGYDRSPVLTELNGFIYVCASSESMVSGTKTEPSIGMFDYWITKMDKGSNIIWDKTIGADMSDLLHDATTSSDNLIIIAGHTKSNVYADKTEPCYGGLDFWVVGIDTLGNLIWDKTIGGSGSDELAFISEMEDNSYLLGGRSESNISGVKNENTNGLNDFWLVQIKPLLQLEKVEIEGLKSYLNPFTNVLYIEFPESCIGKDLVLYDMLGQIVYRTKVHVSKIEINGSSLLSGQYYATLLDENSQELIGTIIHL